MTWTYNPSLALPRDRVRFYCGDTVVTDQLISDEEIAGVLTMTASGERSAAALCCENIGMRFASSANAITDDIGQKVEYGERAQFFQDRARLLRSQLALSALPFAGGLTVTDKDAQETDDDRISPAFAKTLQDAPGTRARSRAERDYTEQP